MIDPSFLYDEILTEEEKQVIDTAKEFGREYFTEDSVRLWYEEGGVPNYVMEAYRDTGLGLLGLTPHLGGVSTNAGHKARFPNCSHGAEEYSSGNTSPT